MTLIAVGFVLLFAGSLCISVAASGRSKPSFDDHWRDVRLAFRDTAINYVPRGGRRA